MKYHEERTTKDSLVIVHNLTRVCQKKGGPLTNQLVSLVSQERYREVINFKFDYTWCFSTDDFLYARQVQAFFSKQCFLDLGEDQKINALNTFYEAEEHCRQTNVRHESFYSPKGDVSSILFGMKCKIAEILGDVPDDGLLHALISTGGDTVNRGLNFNPRIKLSSQLECSFNMIPALGRFLETLPGLCSAHNKTLHLSDILRYTEIYDEHFATLQSKLDFAHRITEMETYSLDVKIVDAIIAVVPKNAITGRTIVIEPLLNKIRQKGIGMRIKIRLREHGLDLRFQKPNCELAQQGSIDDSIATIDLKTASDTVSRGVVWDYLPYPWASLLDESRSASVRLKNPGSEDYIILDLEKFSSMGNGFTFELESLLFYSLTLSVCEHLKIGPKGVRVYGDDICCPTAAVPLLVDCLEELGFIINKDKSYSGGPFRESCGADYLRGFDIRPFYLKNRISDRTLYTMHNFFIRRGERELAKACYWFCDKNSLLFGPDGYGDGHLIGAWEPLQSRKDKRRGLSAAYFETYQLQKRSVKRKFRADYVYPSYLSYARDVSENDQFDDGYLSNERQFVEPASLTDPDVVRGSKGSKRVKIYTFRLGIFT